MFKLMFFFAVLAVAFAAPAPEPGAAILASPYKPIIYSQTYPSAYYPALQSPYQPQLTYPLYGYPGYPAAYPYGKVL